MYRRFLCHMLRCTKNKVNEVTKFICHVSYRTPHFIRPKVKVTHNTLTRNPVPLGSHIVFFNMKEGATCRVLARIREKMSS